MIGLCVVVFCFIYGNENDHESMIDYLIVECFIIKNTSIVLTGVQTNIKGVIHCDKDEWELVYKWLVSMTLRMTTNVHT